MFLAGSSVYFDSGFFQPVGHARYRDFCLLSSALYLAAVSHVENSVGRGSRPSTLRCQSRNRCSNEQRWKRTNLRHNPRRSSYFTACKGIEGRKTLIVEGGERRRRHRHVTAIPGEPRNTNSDGDVTKIEVELAEAPDNAENRLSTILVGSMPSELDSTLEINSTYPGGFPGTGGGPVVVRAEEVLIVILVLVLWVAAIALFFNRWGKIRMLEPYQPKFQQQHRQSCVVIDQNPLPHSSCSKFNVHCPEHVQENNIEEEMARPRQNSVFVGSSGSLLPISQDAPRRAKSAVDLQTSVQAEFNAPRFVEETSNSRLKPTAENWRMTAHDRRRSVCQFDRADTLTRPLQRERGMSICQFDRMDVYGRSPQRERGLSVCHFDRTDVTNQRLYQRDRDSSAYHFDRMDVLARPLLRERGNSVVDRMDVRPTYLGKSLLRERRTSVCNFLEKPDDPARMLQRYRRLSVSNCDKIEPLEKFGKKESQGSIVNVVSVIESEPQPGCSGTTYYFDRPSCSSSTDVILGYKATCV